MNVRPKNKKGLIILLSLIAVVLIGAGVFVYQNFNKQDSNSIIKSQDTPNESESQQALEDKKNAIENQENDTSNSSSSAEESIEIRAKQSGETIVISTKLTGVSSGSCKLSIKANSKSFESTANVIYQSEFSTCAGFSVQKSEIGSGIWSINLETQTPNGTNSKNISFEVR